MNADEMLVLAASTVNRCILCEASDVVVMGCFVPGSGEVERYSPIKPKPNKTRVMWYALCSRCDWLPKEKVAALVEERAERQARAARQ